MLILSSGGHFRTATFERLVLTASSVPPGGWRGVDIVGVIS